MSKVKYSVIVNAPTEDVDSKGHEMIHFSLALKDLDSASIVMMPAPQGNYFINEPSCQGGNFSIPNWVIEAFKGSVAAGNLRCEILSGVVSYKLYVSAEAPQQRMDMCGHDSNYDGTPDNNIGVDYGQGESVSVITMRDGNGNVFVSKPGDRWAVTTKDGTVVQPCYVDYEAGTLSFIMEYEGSIVFCTAVDSVVKAEIIEKKS